jgi:hypothetical protein
MARLLWTQRQDMGPLPRRGHAMAYDPVRKRTVLFGGEGLGPAPTGLPHLADTWEWDGNYWSQVSDIGPVPRGGYAMDWDAASQRILLFGGSAHPDDPTSWRHDTWEWDGENWTQLDDSGPSARLGFALASDTVRQRVVLFGGASASFIANSETWEWSGSAWTQAEETGPAARSGHAWHLTLFASALFCLAALRYLVMFTAIRGNGTA